MQGIGITGSLGSSMPMRPAGVPPQPVRSITTSIRQQTVTNSQSPSSQVSIVFKFAPFVSIVFVLVVQVRTLL